MGQLLSLGIGLVGVMWWLWLRFRKAEDLGGSVAEAKEIIYWPLGSVASRSELWGLSLQVVDQGIGGFDFDAAD